MEGAERETYGYEEIPYARGLRRGFLVPCCGGRRLQREGRVRDREL